MLSKEKGNIYLHSVDRYPSPSLCKKELITEHMYFDVCDIYKVIH